MMNLSEKLIMLRKENGWSQEDFAEKLDVSRQAISRWENGTALPDAQNILRISKLCRVTADYLLNDDYEGEANIPVAEAAAEEPKSKVRKKKYPHWYLFPVICFVLALGCFVMGIMVRTNEGHSHPALSRVIENEIAPTCTTEGSYDEVLYCADCGEVVLRTHISMGMPSHQFYNQTCIICGEEQRAKD